MSTLEIWVLGYLRAFLGRLMLQFIKSLNRFQKRLVLLTVDLTLVPVAFLLTFALQLETGLSWSVLGQILPVSGMVVAIAALLAPILGVPQMRLSTYDLNGVGRNAIFAVLLALAALGLGLLARLGMPLGAYVLFGSLFFAFSALGRIIMLQALLALYRRDETLCRVLIYGAGTTGFQLAQALRSHETIEPVAFADDNPSLQGLTIAGLPVLKPSRIESFTKERQIARVLLAMPSQSLPKRNQIARRLETIGLEVQALPSFAQLIGEETLVDKLAPVLPGQFLGRDQLHDAIQTDGVSFTDQSVLVSGAGGSIGSELCRQLLALRPAKLVLYELSELALYNIDMELRELVESLGTEIVPILGSVTDGHLARKVLADHDVDVVLHAAAYKHVPLVEANPLSGLANNVLGTATLARAAQDAGVARFTLVSSDKAVRPTNVMGASKRLAEMVVQDLADRSAGTVFSMVRFGNVLGSSGSVIPLFQEQIARGGPVTVTHKEVTRYFMTVQEAVRLVLRASTMARGGELFVLNMGEPIAIERLARQMIETSGYSVRDAETPDGDIEIVITGLRPGEKLHEELLIGEGFLTTAHEKIFTAREEHLSEIEIANALRSLREAVASADDTAARAVIARWVETHEPIADRESETV